ncbi:uroporphyrinogen decarboxylase family protein [Eubacteriaceae bacterium ES3]|nr:uroporphyrinogen decarboxylase family protein [Eubacteriaceae bacterium ES3]
MLTPRENFLMATVEHKKPEWVPNEMSDVILVGGSFEVFENGPLGGGLDGFGVTWHATESAGGQPVPGGKPVLEDVTAWEDLVTFPELDAVDWEGSAAMQFGIMGADRDQRVVEYGIWNGQFLRLTHLMGFENALCAMVEEPEACQALFSAITDYKINLVERIAKHFKPDIITNFDDIATEKSLFMSPVTYRELIKPEHKRLNDAIKSLDIIPFIHTCGCVEAVIPDYVEIGTVGWSSAQPMNDIVGIQKKYGSQISVIGGYDTNGKPGLETATQEEMDTEVKRCMETYGPQGSYAFMGFRLMSGAGPESFMEGVIPINAAVEKYKNL